MARPKGKCFYKIGAGKKLQSKGGSKLERSRAGQKLGGLCKKRAQAKRKKK